MLFNSLPFLILVVITFLLYYTKGMRRLQVLILTLSSFVFYAYTLPYLLLLLLFSLIINSWVSHRIKYGAVENRKTLATAGVVVNLGILAFFKYSGMLSMSFLGGDTTVTEFLTAIPLPIGISFFTFQGISLLVDVYTDNYNFDEEVIAKSFPTHLSRTSFYISFFPQLVAGPIVKAHDFMPQISTKYLKDVQWDFIVKTLVMGYFLKSFVADNLSSLTGMKYPNFLNASSENLCLSLFGYSMQIFADFAGYSLIAIGIAAIFGYKLPDNFNFPYISRSFSEFWTRWHISLSSYLKEYLYFPLGGNRVSKMRTYLNLMIVMFLGGLWHGAAWSYAVWGSFHGIALAIERFFNNHFPLKLGHHVWFRVLKMLWVFFLVTLAWLLFRLPDFSEVIAYVQAIFTNTDLPLRKTATVLILLYSIPVIVYHILYLNKEWYKKIFGKVEYVFYAFMLFLTVTGSGEQTAFIYFQF